ncbi:MAG: hypothetical protein ACO3ND_08375 [Opitutales bacterium]
MRILLIEPPKAPLSIGGEDVVLFEPLALEYVAAGGGAAARLFAACGCRDFARADLILESDGRFRFLEINTLPGMTETSLLPKSASCRGLDYRGLVGRMVAPALRRFEGRRAG